MKISDLMAQSGVAFGTSGARGLAEHITDEVAYCYTRAFLQHLRRTRAYGDTGDVAIAGDLRPSTGRIMRAVARAAEDMGYAVENCGRIPSPAIAYFGLQRRLPTVMVTGSHIPDDRNGIKYNTPDGEITKEDEQGIRDQEVEVPEEIFSPDGSFRNIQDEVTPAGAAARLYTARYLTAFDRKLLQGRRIGVYEHSAVGRDILVELYSELGADVVRLGRSVSFIPVDTEAIRPEDVEYARNWVNEHNCEAIVSTDGDSDRPMVSDERGTWLRGDILGILTAKFLKADAVVVPVSCNTAVERCGFFKKVYRTRIGSPYVIAGMEQAARDGYERVVGYEGNGGFLHQQDLTLNGGVLRRLPTRDAVVVHLAVLSLAKQLEMPVSKLLDIVPARFTASDRLKKFPTEKSTEIIGRFRDASEIEKHFGALCGVLSDINDIDGLRMTFGNGEILHLRPSGNAPEFRCYTEADSSVRAQELVNKTLDIVEKLKTEHP